jgi:serine palmitoyltransferase
MLALRIHVLNALVLLQHVSFPIQNGIHLSKAKMVKFKHNDMADLERALKQVDLDERKAR